MTRDDIQKIMDKVPGLNVSGIGVYNERKKTPEQRDEELARDRRLLLDHVSECNKCCDWLNGVGKIEKIKTINSRADSYHLKHVAEEDIGYVTQGVFITAAIYCGFAYRIWRSGVVLGMSEKSIKAIKRRQNAEEKMPWAVR